MAQFDLYRSDHYEYLDRLFLACHLYQSHSQSSRCDQRFCNINCAFRIKFISRERSLPYILCSGIHSIVSIFTFTYLAKRSFQGLEDSQKVKKFKNVIALNAIGVVVTLIIAYVSYQEMLSVNHEIIIFGLGYFFVILWLYLYWNKWKKLLLD